MSLNKPKTRYVTDDIAIRNYHLVLRLPIRHCELNQIERIQCYLITFKPNPFLPPFASSNIPFSLVWWVYWNCGLESHSTMFQLYMRRHTDLQAEWRSWTDARALNARYFVGFFVPVQAPTRGQLVTVIPRNRSILIAFYDVHGDTEDLFSYTCTKTSWSQKG